MKRLIWMLPAAMAIAGGVMVFYWSRKKCIFSVCVDEEPPEA